MARALAKSKSVCRRVTRNPSIKPPAKFEPLAKATGSIVFKVGGCFEVMADGRLVPYVKRH